VEKKAKEFAKSFEEKSQSETKHCSDCEEDLDHDAKFCWKCGNEI